MDPAKDCPDPGTVCVIAACDMGACSTTNATVDTPCTDNGGAFCDGNGNCVTCNSGAQCPDPMNECVIATCDMGACGTSNVADGTATVAGQITGDCKQQVCDGSGGTKVIDDDMDPNDDMNDCTADTCNVGVNVHTPISGACTQSGGSVCADPLGPKAGTCVECNVDADCTVMGEVCDPQFATNTCVALSCTDTAKNGDETDVDCGGSCAACPNTKNCLVAGDCQSGFCNNLVCEACTADANCGATQFCGTAAVGTNGVCTDDLGNGSACTAASQCTSGNCIDGFCCDTACSGTCDACSASTKGQGLDGVCGPVAINTDPDNECATDPPSSCQMTGTCNGASACELHPLGTVCAAQSCVGGVQSNQDTCNGTGTCVDGGTVNCGNFNCNAAGTTCLTTCTGDVDCATGNFCNALSQCVAKLNDGQACTGGNQCSSANCVDGVCCNSACGGLCQACNVAGSLGACTSIPNGTDPANECVGATNCNGSGACTSLINGAPCTLAAECGSGNCVDGVCCNTACGATCQACDVAGNVGTCSNVPSNTDPANECTGTDVCNGAGACIKVNGSACALGTECLSGNCIDGVCCNTACGATCQACNVAGSVGTCSNVPNGTDPANECAGTTNCNGAGACGTLPNGSACTLAAECTSNNCIDGFCCNTACGGLCQACNVAGSQGTCSNVPSNTDPANECAGSDVCNGAGACTKVNGTACGAGGECLSGNCIDGVCCNTSCGGLCQACNVAGNAGTCTPIPAGQDPADECAGPINCDGAGACGLAANGTACSTGAECQSGNCVDNFCCNTACAGTCESCAIAGSVGACTPFANGTDPFGECAGGQVCNGASGCVALADGSACTAGADCLSGNCVDNVCCNTACSGTCQACDLAGSVGVCTNIPNGQDPAPECPGAQVCNGAGACVGAGDGTACSAGSECASGNCIDGVCCNTACGGTCEACTVAGFVGTCTPITAGQDPALECADPYQCGGASSCQSCSDGFVNGNETDVDCGGGGACGACANTKACILNSDCLSNNCVLNVCAAPAPACGNSVLDAGEGCDDGNTANNDGCSSSCQVEVPYSCVGTGPGSCKSTKEINCGDGVDNDGDALIDCADPDCAPGCAASFGAACGVGESLLVYTSADVPKSIPDNSTVGITSTINVGGLGIVKRVVLGFTIPHTFDGDLDLSLISPGNVSTDASSDNGGAGVNYTSTVLNSAGGAACATAVTAGTAPFTGCFTPEASFNVYNNTQAKGGWGFKAVDDAGGDTGTITVYTLSLCVAPTTCGDGVVNAGETCDDGNSVNGDGCSSACAPETGFNCTGTAPSVCSPICGDGLLKGNEQCEDGNAANNDGCSSTCQVEPFYQCTQAIPAVCTKQEINCNDGIDNDGDGFIDGADSDCTLPAYFIACGVGQTLQVYNSVDLPKAVPDNNTTGITSVITAMLGGTVQKAAIQFTIPHTFDGDLDFTFISPGNLSFDASSDNGGAGVNYTNTILDTACTTNVTAGAAPFSGCFKPEVAFTSLNGTSVNGKWQLKVADDASGDTGTLNQYRLILCTN